jgi:hypothetical protein
MVSTCSGKHADAVVAEKPKITGRWNDGRVDATRRDSRANLALISEVEAMGVTGVTTRKLERWRQAGALPRTRQESHGRAGTVTHWPPATARQVKALVGLLGQGTPLRRCPFALFALGFPIDVTTLRAGYLEFYEDLGTRLAGLAPEPAGPSDPLDRADAVARAVAQRAGRDSATRRWERRTRRSSPRHEARMRLQDALFTSLSGLIAGEAPTTAGVADLLTVAGLDGQQDPDAVAAVLRDLHQERTMDAIRNATLSDWERARAACADTFEWMRLQRSAEMLTWADDQRFTGLDDLAGLFDDSAVLSRAELIPVFLNLAPAEWLDALGEQLGQLRAFAAISADLPQVFGPAAVRNREALTDQEREEAGTLVAEWLGQHPTEAAVLEPLWDTDPASDGPDASVS